MAALPLKSDPGGLRIVAYASESAASLANDRAAARVVVVTGRLGGGAVQSWVSGGAPTLPWMHERAAARVVKFGTTVLPSTEN
jgi:hypothetical protein